MHERQDTTPSVFEKIDVVGTGGASAIRAAKSSGKDDTLVPLAASNMGQT